MAQLQFLDFFTWDEIKIRETFLNRASSTSVHDIIKTHDYIKSIIEIAPEEDYPDWYVENFNAIIAQFFQILRIPLGVVEPEFQHKIESFQKIFVYNNIDSRRTGISFSLPFLENFARNLKLEKDIQSYKETFDSVGQSLKASESSISQEIKFFKERFDTFKADADTTLALVKQEAGKIVVKDYAKIFDQQALEHSNFLCDPKSTDGYKFKFTLGKAQSWMLFAVISLSLLIYSYTKLDTIFSLKDEKSFTPEVIVHMIGRIVSISLFIFIVSFCFKQFRVNMHLYTLNRHRANTLKSFEYLTHSPDPLAPESYNAILMEVAKAIYESGHTGYINVGDTNPDMPSIIDMSKVITQPRS